MIWTIGWMMTTVTKCDWTQPKWKHIWNQISVNESNWWGQSNLNAMHVKQTHAHTCVHRSLQSQKYTQNDRARKKRGMNEEVKMFIFYFAQNRKKKEMFRQWIAWNIKGKRERKNLTKWKLRVMNSYANTKCTENMVDNERREKRWERKIFLSKRQSHTKRKRRWSEALK